MKVGIALLCFAALGLASATQLCTLDEQNACRDYSTAGYCDTMNYCKAEIWSRPLGNSTVLCQMCQDDVKNLEKFISAKTTKAFVKYDLLAMCRFCPLASGRDECKKLINDNFDKIYKDLVDKLNATIICRALHLCRSGGFQDVASEAITAAKDSETRQVVTSYMCSTLDSLNACRDYGTARRCDRLPQCKDRVWSGPTQKGQVACDFCKTEMARFQKWVKNATTEAKIKKELQTFCMAIPLTAFRDECNQLVKEDFDTIYEDIAALLGPDTICTAMGLCKKALLDQNIAGRMDKQPRMFQKTKDSETRRLLTSYMCSTLDSLNACRDYGTAEGCGTLPQCKERVWSRSMQNGDVICDYCKTEMARLESWVKKNTTKAEIKKELSAFCNAMVLSAFRDECNKQLQKNFETIYKDIVHFLNPEIICAAMRLCKPTLIDQNVQGMVGELPGMLQSENGESCSDCGTFMSRLLHTAFENKKVLKGWMKMLKLKCQATDDALVCEEHVDMIFYQTMKLHRGDEEVNAQPICKAINMCDVLHLQGDEDICGTCKIFFKEWQDELRNNPDAIDKVVKAASELYCLQKPAEVQAMCVKYVSMVIKVMIQQMEDKDPNEICADMGFCQPEEKETSPAVVKAILIEPAHEKVEGPVLCEICKEVMGHIDSMIDFNSTEKEIQDALDSACMHLPKRGSQCQNFVDTYGKRIIDLILKFATSPSLVCEAMRLCGGIPVACEVCEEVMDYVDHRIHYESTEQEIIDALDSACGHLPKIASRCRNFVDTYGKKIVDMILRVGTNPKLVCKALMLCGSKQEVEMQEKPVSSMSVCELCQYVSGALDDMMKDNMTQAEIKTALQEICSILPSKYKDECNLLISQYWDTVVSIIVEELDPKVFCVDVRLCPQKEAEKKVSADTPCEVCEKVAGALHDMLNDNATQSEVESALKRVCLILPSVYKSQCDSMIDQYFREIVDFLVQQSDPSVICTELHLCPSLGKIREASGDSQGCQICKEFARELRDLLSLNSTQALIEKALGETCNLLPQKDRKMCSDVLIQSYEEFMKVLLKELEPDVICSDLRLCMKKIERNEAMNGQVCQICQGIAQRLHDLLALNSTQTAMEKALVGICNLLPQANRKMCSDILTKAFEEYMKVLVKELEPNVICSDLRLCPKKMGRNKIVNSAPKGPEIKLAPMKMYINKDDEVCAVCKQMIEIVDQLLKDNHTEAALEIALKQVCSYLPDALQDECDSMVKQYAPIIFQYIDQIGNPSFICEHLKLCPTDDSSNILGGDKCTYGPTYWCRDMETAKACHAVQHCEDHVWK